MRNPGWNGRMSPVCPTQRLQMRAFTSGSCAVPTGRTTSTMPKVRAPSSTQLHENIQKSEPRVSRVLQRILMQCKEPSLKHQWQGPWPLQTAEKLRRPVAAALIWRVIGIGSGVGASHGGRFERAQADRPSAKKTGMDSRLAPVARRERTGQPGLTKCQHHQPLSLRPFELENCCASPT